MTPAELTARGVRVKPLEWRKCKVWGDTVFRADWYDIWARSDGRFGLEGAANGFTDFTAYPTLEAAKAAAQADYEARICAALTTGENDD